MKVLVTGGCGYIGSHTCVQLLNAGHEVVIVDNLFNSKPSVLKRIAALTPEPPRFYKGDIRDRELLDAVFRAEKIDSVIHFAGLKAVGESVRIPLTYYDNNVYGTIQLLHAMREAGVHRLVFSSSATVYGELAPVPYKEEYPVSRASSPYGQTKIAIEYILKDLAAAEPDWSIILLRYFNPVGAHPSGTMGEDPQGIPNNLMPYIAQVAVGRLPEMLIYGNDYPTKDGTGVRDFIHVMDLADGHVLALEWGAGNSGCRAFNLGAGKGYSVMDLLHSFSKALGRELPYRFVGRRAGDLAAFWADASLAREVLGFETRRGIDEMTADVWRWQSVNPNGYPDE
ncbi:MAG: UDP-glucose 4-epimerase GalE [Methylobacteriaceae bacterium]|jgi:UDP-glucose 4-epimerase|nr:UDP-glucose 4-epimerase GalE [Methylobacteriaceae bacterium]